MTTLTDVQIWQYGFLGISIVSLLAAFMLMLKKNSVVSLWGSEKQASTNESAAQMVSLENRPNVNYFSSLQSNSVPRVARTSTRSETQSNLQKTVRIQIAKACSSSQKLLAALNPLPTAFEQQEN